MCVTPAAGGADLGVMGWAVALCGRAAERGPGFFAHDGLRGFRGGAFASKVRREARQQAEE